MCLLLFYVVVITNAFIQIIILFSKGVSSKVPYLKLSLPAKALIDFHLSIAANLVRCFHIS